MLKMITFIVTLAAMALGMSYLPLFPQPLPILLAVLVAFVTYQKPRFGMPIGGALLGIGLLYQLSKLYFISFLGDTPVRIAFIIVWMGLFVVLPLMFKRYKSALAINFGIFAFVSLFFEPLYFMAIPLIFASAVYFKKYVGLTAVYFVLLSVPLQLYQYYQYTVLPFSKIQSDWWTMHGSAPPLFVSLSSVSENLTSSISQFRLYDTSNFIYDIAGQTTWIPNWNGVTIKDALSQYIDSMPGIILFVVIVAGLAVAFLFFSRILAKEGLIGSSDRFFPCFSATIAAAVFFILLSTLQVPLAFTTEIGITTMVFGILGTALLTLPVMFMDYTPKQRATNQQIAEKAQTLLEKVIHFEGQVANVKEAIPITVSSTEGKTSVLKYAIEDTLKKAVLHQIELDELDEKYSELEKLDQDYEAIAAELNTILSEYQVFSNCEFANWVGKLKVEGLDVKTTANVEFQKEVSIEQRTEAIKQLIEAGKNLVRELTCTTVPIYSIISSLYDPTLPAKSHAIEFASEKIAKNQSPWIAVEALYNALNNWKRQYGSDMKITINYFQNSLKPITRLASQTESIVLAFGDNTPKVQCYAKKACELKTLALKRLNKERLGLQDIVGLRDDVETFIAMSTDILEMLHKALVDDELAIDRLSPTKDFLWEKNDFLHEWLEAATMMLSQPSKYKINEIMTNLSKSLVNVDAAIQTLALYAERKELLLNYPLAEAAISNQLEVKGRLLPMDLPFQPYFASEYLRLFYMTRLGEYLFNKENSELIKRS